MLYASNKHMCEAEEIAVETEAVTRSDELHKLIWINTAAGSDPLPTYHQLYVCVQLLWLHDVQ